MHEIPRHLPEGARVLDVGSRGGSFRAAQYPLRTTRLDLDPHPRITAVDFVQADAARLPFGSHVLDAVVANHSLEHFESVNETLKELGRVIKADGSLYIAVPDASTFADRLYRWLASGGGHVNAFRSHDDLVARIERHTGLGFRAGRVPLTSPAMLNRRNRTAPAPRKLALLGSGSESVLRSWSIICRLADRWLGAVFRRVGRRSGRQTLVECMCTMRRRLFIRLAARFKQSHAQMVTEIVHMPSVRSLEFLHAR